MTATTDDHDRRILAFLDRKPQQDFPPTAGEIHAALHIPLSSVRRSLKRLVDAGTVRKAGAAFNNGVTWTRTGGPA